MLYRIIRMQRDLDVHVRIRVQNSLIETCLEMFNNNKPTIKAWY